MLVDDIGGAAGVLLKCIKKCPIDLRRVLASRVVVCGGGANIKGLVDRVLNDAVQLTKDGSYYPEYADMSSTAAHFSAAPIFFCPSYMAWVGGSIFSADKVFKCCMFLYVLHLQMTLFVVVFKFKTLYRCSSSRKCTFRI